MLLWKLIGPLLGAYGLIKYRTIKYRTYIYAIFFKGKYQYVKFEQVGIYEKYEKKIYLIDKDLKKGLLGGSELKINENSLKSLLKNPEDVKETLMKAATEDEKIGHIEDFPKCET